MPLYISNIKRIIKSKKYSVNEIAELISISGNGLHLALKNNTLKVRDLEKIAEILGVSPAVFFDNDHETINITSRNTQKGTGNYIQQGSRKENNCGVKVELLKERVKGLEKEIELKDEIIELLKGK
jgi:transcriptional regulator with XRE-family HTH domain